MLRAVNHSRIRTMTSSCNRLPSRPAVVAALLAAACGLAAATGRDQPATQPVTQPAAQLATQLAVGDLVFIRVPWRPFVEVATATGSWTNHVGVVVEGADGSLQVAESTLPWSRRSPLPRFVDRSEGGRVAVMRLATPLTPAQSRRVGQAADARMGVRYDTGFDLRSSGQFCSRFAREVLAEATGTELGEVETFAHLLQRRPDSPLGFWQLWYFGRIPWQRQTVTPASLLASPALVPVFDGRVDTGCQGAGCTSNASSTRDTML